MRTPVSWLREYVDLPDDLSTPELARRLTALGLKLESLERPGHDITGPLVIGRVLTLEAEPQKNGKTINWCTVDVGAANGTGEPQGIVCGAHNFGVGDLVVVVLPGGVLPGPFEISARKTYGHVSAGMICSPKELGLGDDHDGIIVLPADAGEPGDDVFELLQLRDEVIEFEINPDRAYALSLRGVAREAALALGDVSAFHDPADRDVPAPNADGYPVEVEDAAGCPVFAARTVTGFDPAAPDADLAGPPPAPGRHAVDLAGRRRHQLRDARARPADPRLRRRQAVRPDPGPPRHRGREADHPRRREADALGRGPRHHRRLRPDRPGRRHGRRDHRDVGDHHPHRHRGGALGRGVDVPHRQAPQALLRGRQAQRARRRPDPARGRRGPRGRAAHHVRRRHRPPRRHAGRHRPEAAPIRIGLDLPGRIAGLAIDDDTVTGSLVSIGAGVAVDGHGIEVTPPPWRPDLTDPYDLVEEVVRLVGYDRIPSVLPTAPPGRGLTRAQKLRRRVGRTLAGEGYVEVITLPVHR